MTAPTPLRNLEPRREEMRLHGRRISYLTAGEGPLLRAAALPGSELVIAGTVGPITALGRASVAAVQRLGLRFTPDLGEVGRGFATLADRDGRAAFLDTLRSVVNFSGQRVDASDRLYLAAE